MDDGFRRKLPELALIDEIEALEKRYRTRYGRFPTNVSHWDPSKQTIRALRALLPVTLLTDAAPYRYSYLINRRSEAVRKFGFSAPDVGVLITENGSSSIAAAANWLMLAGVREVAVLRPCYFTVPYNFSRLGIAVRDVVVPHCGEAYALPTELGLSKGQALWLTNPVYNTGIYSLELQIAELTRIADAGVIVIADEALALLPSRIASALGGHPNFLGIYTPHKSICLNGLKFSALVFHRTHENVFDDWADVLLGGLSISAVAAFDHFLHADFDAYQHEFLKLVDQTRRWHNDLLNGFYNKIQTDSGSRGHFITVYVPELPAIRGNDTAFLAQLMDETGCAIIPGTRSGFDPRLGFCFRVNLARDCSGFRAALTRLYATALTRFHA